MRDSEYTFGLTNFCDQSKEIKLLKDQLAQKEAEIAHLKKRAKVHRNDKYKQKVKTEEFINSGAVSKRRFQFEKAKFLFELINKNKIQLTNKQVAELCFISLTTAYKAKREATNATRRLDKT